MAQLQQWTCQILQRVRQGQGKGLALAILDDPLIENFI